MQLYQYEYNIGNNNNEKNDSMKKEQFQMNF